MYKRIKEQSCAKSLLINAVETNKINHCYIFSGNEGTGRFLLAKEFAKSIVCKEKSGCNKCIPCKQFSDNTSPDYKVIDLLEEKGKTKKAITVDQIREVVADIYIKPSVFEKKIYIIKNADKMNINAQNAILKSLEEPPSYVIFILIVTNTELLLPTIVSRGTIVNFTPLTEKTVKEIIKENYEIDIPDSLLSLSMGSVTEAYKISISEEHKNIRDEIIKTTLMFFKEKNTVGLLRLYGLIIKYEKEKEFVFNVINTVIFDIIKKNENADVINKDADYNNINIKTGQLYDISNITFELIKRLNSNIKYNLAVLSALNDIRAVLLG